MSAPGIAPEATQTGVARPNLVVAKLGVNGAVDLLTNRGTTDVVVDVVGWYS